MPAATPQCLTCDEVSPESCIQPQWQRKIKYTTHIMQISKQRRLAPFLSDLTTDHHLQDPYVPLSHLHLSNTKSNSLHSNIFSINTHCFQHWTFTFCCTCFLVNKMHCITKDRTKSDILGILLNHSLKPFHLWCIV